ncbi:hypothetical protein PhCBS80983_g05876 [Powellomyces hirtus]|uniref:Uncharacterized protein n=1 Tax=Powellomyces hirtus TaxID=109895 RepID=A0A507DUG2_9FUNG|nr:hypothetical protein PhCBS80983_g05876 [Powellomyces hirtus]
MDHHTLETNNRHFQQQPQQPTLAEDALIHPLLHPQIGQFGVGEKNLWQRMGDFTEPLPEGNWPAFNSEGPLATANDTLSQQQYQQQPQHQPQPHQQIYLQGAPTLPQLSPSSLPFQQYLQHPQSLNSSPSLSSNCDIFASQHPSSQWSSDEALAFLASNPVTSGSPSQNTLDYSQIPPADSSIPQRLFHTPPLRNAELIDLTNGSSSDEASSSPRKRKATLPQYQTATGNLIDPQFAKRRVMNLLNPGGPSQHSPWGASTNHYQLQHNPSPLRNSKLQNGANPTLLHATAPHIGSPSPQIPIDSASEVVVIEDSPQPARATLAPAPARRLHQPLPAFTTAAAHMRASTVSAPSSSSDTVDLTDIDPTEEAKLKRRAQLDLRRELVCYGMVRTTIARLNYEAYKELCGTEKHMRVVIAPDVSTPYVAGINTCVPFRLEAQDGTKLGRLPEEISIVISPFFKQLVLEASIPRCQYNKYTAPLNIILIGPLTLAMPIGTLFQKCNIQLQDVNRPIAHLRYFNPHRQAQLANGGATPGAALSAPGSPSFSSAWCRPERASTPNGEDVKNQIDAVYDAITSAEDLGEADADPSLVTPLYKHQRQALHFMTERERPVDFANRADHARSLWKAQQGAYTSVITTEVVRAVPTQALGGILADDMGLGKTIELISLILKNRPLAPVAPPRPKTPPPQPRNPYPFLPSRQPQIPVQPADPKELDTIPSRCTLIICPLSTVANWEEQIHSHVSKGALRVYVYHGPNRRQDAKNLATYDVVITTYNVLALEYGKEQKTLADGSANAARSPLQAVYWLRIVLDEAHVIKERNTHQARAAFALSGERRWCLTGTPIHNKIDDLFSLFRFLGLEPFNDWKSFSHFIMKPLKLNSTVAVSRLQTVMKLVTLRRTKNQKIDGRPILSLPPKRQVVFQLTLDPAEQSVYDKVFEKARAIFNDLDKTGKVFRYYAALLEMLLRLRQCVSHVGLIKDWKGFGEITDVVADETGDLPPLTTERAAHLLSLLKDSGDEKCCICSEVLDGEGDKTIVISRCGHLFCNECTRQVFEGTIKGFMCPMPMCQVPLCKEGLKEIKDIEAAENIDEAATAAADTSNTDGNANSSGLMGLDSASVLTSSTKVRALIADLTQVRNNCNLHHPEETPIKSVVFSQWTQMLDFVQPALTENHFKYVRLDGKMSRADRTLSLEKFKFDPSVTVILVSLKAGGVGLNLTMASRVYILEPYWNPAVEDQAQDRVHRMGQVRPVEVIRFVVEGSVEEVIEGLKKRKRELVATAFRDEKGTAAVDEVLGAGAPVAGAAQRKLMRVRQAKDKEEMQLKRLSDLRALFGFKNG